VCAAGETVAAAATSKAGELNIIQIILNAAPLASAPTVLINNYELVTQAFGEMPHLASADAALFSNPPNITAFVEELGFFFASPDELSEFANLIENIAISNGVTFAKSEFLNELTTLAGWPVRVIWAGIQAFGYLIDFGFRYPAGSISFDAQ
jgi:hypothetical protein